ncbi:MAG TPA: prepilin-type N-terminal cleavage/methylation domain-containing protein [Longimicrobiales bacterium]|nr:prepilin-type N-terminal cleavage/methylation domain-containing protein [Longimicrobiales bacterium]
MTPAHAPEAGFTLIEVMGALLIFAMGVLIAVELSDALAAQVERSAVRAEVVTTAQERLDSLDRLHYDSLDLGTRVDTLSIRGHPYVCSTVVEDYAPRVRALRVSVVPVVTAGWPSQSLSSYVYEPW